MSSRPNSEIIKSHPPIPCRLPPPDRCLNKFIPRLYDAAPITSLQSSTSMATTDNALTIHNDVSELPELSPNQGVEAFKDIVFGSVSHALSLVILANLSKVAGMIGKVIEYPFDTVKVRLQSQPDHRPLRYNGPLDCFRQSFQAEGLRGLYRGISAPMAGAAVENSCLFFSYRVVQDILRATCYTSAEPLPFSALLLSGAASGSITSLALTPIELIKCKMQVPAETPKARAPGPLTLIGSVFRQDGFLGFWRGQMGTLIRETGGGAAWFGGYEGVSAMFRSYHHSPTNDSSQVESAALPLYQQMLAGATAGISYNFLFFPADTIKSRVQTEDISKTSFKRQTFLATGKALWRQQGLRGLYRGCGITCARSAPSSAFIFTIFEGLRNYFG